MVPTITCATQSKFCHCFDLTVCAPLLLLYKREFLKVNTKNRALVYMIQPQVRNLVGQTWSEIYEQSRRRNVYRLKTTLAILLKYCTLWAFKFIPDHTFLNGFIRMYAVALLGL